MEQERARIMATRGFWAREEPKPEITGEEGGALAGLDSGASMGGGEGETRSVIFWATVTTSLGALQKGQTLSWVLAGL